MKMVFPVIAKQRWDMQGEDGRQVKGGKIFVFDGDLIDTPDKQGVFPTTFAVDHSLFDKLQTVPGKYELELSMKVGSKGQFSVTEAKFVSEYKI